MATNRMTRFQVFIGTWNTTGEVLKTEGAPASALTATDTYRWLPGKHFIAHEADARFDGTPTRSMEVIGYDLASARYLARSYDDQGQSELFEVELKGKKWRIKGKTARFSGMFDASGDKLTGLWELKGTKSGWQPWIKLKLVRA
jgi:hypothetical protein